MHDSSFAKMQAFVDEYLSPHRDDELLILDVGSRQIHVDTGFRVLFDAPQWRYTGLDLEPGKNVDVVIRDPFCWSELDADSVDVVVSGQVLEHVDYFWASAFEIARVLRPGGVAAIIAPSAGPEHRYPLDCWRFYPDGFDSLARFVGFDSLEVYTDWGREPWADSMLVMRKPVWDAAERAEFRRRHAHQRAALPDGRFIEPSAEPSAEPSTGSGAGSGAGSGLPAPSVLAGLEGGRLAAILDAQRAGAGLPLRLPPSRPVPLWSRVKTAIVVLLGPEATERVRRILRRS